MDWPTVLICGTDDVATACALRLFRAGLKPVLLSEAVPYDLHHHRTFTRAVHAGQKSIDSIRARTWSNALEQQILPLKSSLNDFIRYGLLNHEIPLVLQNEIPRGFKFPVNFAVVFQDDHLKTIKDFLMDDAVVIGTQEIKDATVHYRVATYPYFWGRVIYPFNKDPFIASKYEDSARLVKIKAPKDGIFQSTKEIGQIVFKKEEIGFIDKLPLISSEEGLIGGQLNSGIYVRAGQVVAEVIPKNENDTLRLLPVRAFALAGGILEAICYHWHGMGR